MKKLSMKQIRKDRQKAIVKMLNFWYKYETFTTEKFRCIMAYQLIER